MKRGYVVSGLLYTLLVLFMVLMISFLYNMQNKKNILDRLKTDIVNAENCAANLVATQNRIDLLQSQIDEKNQQISDLESNLTSLQTSANQKTLLAKTSSLGTWKTVTTENMSIYKWIIFMIRKSSETGELYHDKSIIKYEDLKKYTSSSNYMTIGQGNNNQDLIKAYWISNTSIGLFSTSSSTDTYVTVYGTNSQVIDTILGN